MLKTRIALLAVGTVAVMAANAHAATRVFVQIGAPVPVYAPAPPPAPVYAPPLAPVVVAGAPVPYGYVWRPGHYVWTGYEYRLVPAAYVRRPYAGAVWVAPRYVARPHGSAWVAGYWRH